MKTKVCPCCDQPIQGMYCKGCRKIVWKPVEQNITYYLNQRHPEYEENCSYHGNTAVSRNRAGKQAAASGNSAVRNADHRMTASESEAKKAEIRERMAERKRELQNAPKQTARTAKRTETEFGSANKTVLNGEAGRRMQTTKNSSAVKKIVIGIVIYLVLSFGSVIGIVFLQILDSFRSWTLF